MRRNTAALFGLILAVTACGGEMRGTSPPSDEEPPGSGGRAPSIDAGADRDAGAGGSVEPGDAATGGTGGFLPHSGSRITVEGWVGEGSPLGVKEVRDTKTGVTCAPRLAEDGTTRCLPPVSGVLYYLDAECTEPIFGEDTNCDGDYGTYDVGGICGVTRVARRGRSVPAPEKVYTGTKGACYEQTAAGTPWFEAIPSPPDEWTLLERELVQVTEQLGVELWAGDDGSRLLGGPRLLPDDQACEPVRVEGDASDSLRCMPVEHVTSSGVFTEGCHGSLVAAPECLDPRVMAVQTAAGQCGASYKEIGKQVPLRDVHWMVNGPCVPANESWIAGFDYYELGEPVNFARYPKLERVTADSGTPRRTMLVSEGKEVLPFDAAGVNAIDPRSGNRCSPADFPDGQTRCVDAISESGYFSDAACTDQLAAVSPCSDPRSTPTWVARYSEAVLSADGCTYETNIVELREVGAEYTGPVYWSGFDTGCEPAPFELTVRFFEIGRVVPSSGSFPAIKVAPL